jgi:hypothetical protein
MKIKISMRNDNIFLIDSSKIVIFKEELGLSKTEMFK